MKFKEYLKLFGLFNLNVVVAFIQAYSIFIFYSLCRTYTTIADINKWLFVWREEDIVLLFVLAYIACWVCNIFFVMAIHVDNFKIAQIENKE